ncbi:MAG: peptidase C39 family protein [Bifidobacteriaceae bacterium]|jgi:predicted double-glycine peptidase|nr:peptidase C39 family protein [Bifidobacteriaceae bacterium]
MVFRAITVPLGGSGDLAAGLDLPAVTAAALAQAGGVLVRTLYLATPDGLVADGLVADGLVADGLAADGLAIEGPTPRGSAANGLAPGGPTTSDLLEGPPQAALLGYHRPRTAQEKLTAFGGSAEWRDGLIEFADAEARRRGAVSVKTQFEGALPPRPPSYYRQSTEFTCGPAALMTGLARIGLAGAPDQAEELQLWREATTILATDPYGLALAAVRRGATAEVVASAESTLARTNPLAVVDRGAGEFFEQVYRAQARAAGIPGEVRGFDVAEVASRVQAGQVVILLVDELEMHGEACPHWVAVTGFEAGVAFVEDPWTDSDYGETWIDAHELAVREEDLAALMWTGDPPVQAFIALGREDS